MDLDCGGGVVGCRVGYGEDGEEVGEGKRVHEEQEGLRVAVEVVGLCCALWLMEGGYMWCLRIVFASKRYHNEMFISPDLNCNSNSNSKFKQWFILFVYNAQPQLRLTNEQLWAWRLTPESSKPRRKAIMTIASITASTVLITIHQPSSCLQQSSKNQVSSP